LEVITIAVFTVDYILRLVTCDIESPRYAGFVGRLRYLPTFYSLVDLASTLPFYIDALSPNISIEATQFLRMFRFFRMLRVEGRYTEALMLFDDVFREQKGILAVALFIGTTTWVAVASLYYLAERRNSAMIYCPNPASDCEEGIDDMSMVDTSLCTFDSWGLADCTKAGCPPSDYKEHPCYNVYNSIISSSYFSLLNLFGEFPLIDQHSTAGKFVGTITAVLAVAVFALPVGLVGNGLESVISRRREELKNNEQTPANDAEEGAGDIQVLGGIPSEFQNQTTVGSKLFDHIINALTFVVCLSFAIDTVYQDSENIMFRVIINNLELTIVCIFTAEYFARFYSYGTRGGLNYVLSFVSVVDMASFLPYWIQVAMTGNIVPSNANSMGSTTVRVLRLFRILRFERYLHAFGYFDDVMRMNADILVMTGFAALVVWVFFSAALYITERNNPDDEMAGFYKTVPDAMWVTLLNLSGESPLCNYSVLGKISTGIIGLFATALFGIPIGVLGAGFEEVIDEVTEETPDEDDETNGNKASDRGFNGSSRDSDSLVDSSFSTSTAEALYKFTNGLGSTASLWFEGMIYLLICLTVSIGIIQTIKGHEDTLSSIEFVAVLIFTFEYILRVCGSAADPDLAGIRNPFLRRLRYTFSFYSIIDLLAIVPFYLALVLPGGWVDAHDEYFRMLRLLRLLKLDKYVPSISLIDDVFRLKRQALAVTCFAAISLWVVFSGILYLTEYQDDINEIDEVPVYGCDEDCTMMDRFSNYFASAIYTGIHLTGDYPIITYSLWARVTCFVMVIAAVGVVAIPSGLVASGFTDIVQEKNRSDHVERAGAAAGDDWYEFRLIELRNERPPNSAFGPAIDNLQYKVNAFLNGEVSVVPHTHVHPHTFQRGSRFFRVSMLILITANVFAVLVESIPDIDKKIGNQPGNFFDSFEAISIFFFTLEYGLRVFSARKNLEALYSPWVYCTTFFGIVDFLSTAPWYVQQILLFSGMSESNDTSTIFRVFRIFRILQLEDFLVGFRKIDNVIRASRDVLKATGLMAVIIWVGCGALFFIFEQSNSNFRECDPSIPLRTKHHTGCYDFESTAACEAHYGDGMCVQSSFSNMPDSLFYVAVFLGGEWGLVDFTWGGRMVCMFLCVIGIALYAIPVGTLFQSFGSVIGMDGEDDEEEKDDE